MIFTAIRKKNDGMYVDIGYILIRPLKNLFVIVH